jgi:hypothetical protein
MEHWTMTDAGPFALPVTVGVTGHRSIAPDRLDAIERSVLAVLEHVRTRAPNAPLLVLTSLAEGADRLVARLAVERFGARIIAVLPREADDYRKDFLTRESNEEFDRLLDKASRIIVTGRRADEPKASEEEARRTDYAHAGYWVSLHSVLLLALWDGEEARGDGGTATIVKARLKGQYPELNDEDPLQYSEGGTVAHVVTSRAGEKAPLGAGEIRWLHPDVDQRPSATRGSRFDEILRRFRHVNDLCAKDRRSLDTWSELELRGSGNAGRGPGLLPAPSHVAALKAAAEFFAHRFQVLTQYTVAILAALTVFAALAPLLDRVVGQAGATFLAGAALAAGVAIWLYANSSQWHLNHASFRALAEGARIQMAWASSGDAACVSDNYHPVQASAVEWIRCAIRTAHLLDDIRPPARPASPEERKCQAKAALAWIGEQVDYFLGSKGVLPKYRRRGRIFAATGIACLVTGLLVLATGKLLDFAPIDKTMLDQEALMKLAKVGLAATASLQAYQAFMAFKDLERSFAVTAHLFRLIEAPVRSADAAGDYDRLAALVRAIGRAALVENVAWLILKRQRGLRPPVG